MGLEIHGVAILQLPNEETLSVESDRLQFIETVVVERDDELELTHYYSITDDIYGEFIWEVKEYPKGELYSVNHQVGDFSLVSDFEFSSNLELELQADEAIPFSKHRVTDYIDMFYTSYDESDVKLTAQREGRTKELWHYSGPYSTMSALKRQFPNATSGFLEIIKKELEYNGTNEWDHLKELESAEANYSLSLVGQNQLVITLAEQEKSTQLKINLDGEIDFDPQFGIVNSARVESLKPQIFRLISEAHGYFTDDGSYFSFVADVLDAYRNEIDCPPERTDFASVFILAGELEAALEEARLATGGGNTPQLHGKHAAKVRAILKANRALMMASEVGTDLVAESEIYDETPEEAREARGIISDLREEVKKSEGVFANAAKQKVVSGLKGGGVKKDIVARKIAKNIGIVTVGVVAVTAAPAISLVSAAGAVAAGVVGGVGLLFGGGAVAKAGKELTIDMPPVMERGLQSVRAFTLKNQERIAKAVAILDKGNWFKRAIQQIQQEQAKFEEENANKVDDKSKYDPIFISYRHSTESDLFDYTRIALNEVGLEVVSDYKSHSKQALSRSLEETMSESKSAIILITDSFFDSEFAKQELAYLLYRRRRGELRFYPILIDISPDALHYRAPLLSEYLYTQVKRPDFKKAINKIVHEIKTDIVSGERDIS